MKTFDLILRPVITEKATAHEKNGKFMFFVRNDATKIDIKEAFKIIYGVVAVKVNIMRTPSKTRLGVSRRPTMKKHEFKKVIVTTKGKKAVDLTKMKIKA